MRRLSRTLVPLARTLAPLAAAGALTLTVTGSAFAANGFLEIDGVVHSNPSGCFEIARLSAVFNFTDIPALVHNIPGCRGSIVRIIPPGEELEVPGTHSVFLS
ncbi:hypothetical protein [Streptomyces naphthomycinicus]|uniref:hypothetical protein n=1 Tax=Streptomyces naphthomycinicus TaxID=2872625 RepID=UPI001CEC6796|nr:hypothetical protein [Streptomyces sp. TML10]